jgi:osmotically-inducible protein OsmY
VRVAEDVPEVKSVASQLTFGPGESATNRSLIESLDDEKVELQVKAALSLNRNSRGLPITVKAFRGVVTLSGAVATPEQKALVVAVARDTPGVSEVTDAIAVAPQDGRSPHPLP